MSKIKLVHNKIMSISPLDGRYSSKISNLRSLVSEYALIKYRVFVEIEWFKKLASISEIGINLSDSDLEFLNSIVNNFSIEDAKHIKQIEKITNHDVKAVEYFIKEKFQSIKNLLQYVEFIHFACTSEDINNIAYALILKNSLSSYLKKCLHKIVKNLSKLAKNYSSVSMLARTHGQSASPTTVGKEFAVFATRLSRQLDGLNLINVYAKFNGASGNYNAHVASYPSLNWINISNSFIKSFDLKQNFHTTQIESHDYMAEIFDCLARCNNIIVDACRDMWLYISMNYFKLKVIKNEIGSSAMPHKVNPIMFENAEGNLLYANSILKHLSSNLTISRLQRDLTDSTLLRNIGVAIAHTMLGYKMFLNGLLKIEINIDAINQDLEKHYEVIAECIQTILRKNKVSNSYEKLKELTRGQFIDRGLMIEFITGLDIPENEKKYLLELLPSQYIGKAEYLATHLNLELKYD